MLRLRGLLVAVLGVVCAVLMVGVGSASAAYTYSFSGQLSASGGFGQLEAGSVAVDDGNGDTYVVSSGAHALDVFETATKTQLASLTGTATPAGSFGSLLAVAANNGTGDVYVLDKLNNVVDVFDGTGSYVCQITGASTPSPSECNGVAGSDTPAHELGSVNGGGALAVDQATGDIYVVDERVGQGAIDVFGAGGAYLRQILLSALPTGFGSLESIAVDASTGGVYVSDGPRHVVYVFNALGEYVTTWTGANTPAQSFGNGSVSVAVDDAGGEVLVTDSEQQHQVTDIFRTSGEYVSLIPESSVNGTGTTVDQANGNVYISDLSEDVVYIFQALFVPDVTTGAASNARPTSVTLSGTVNPDGMPVTSCLFEYGPEASYGQTTPCAQSPGGGSSPVAVSAEAGGLQEGVTYHYRLVAGNANGTNQGSDAQVTTPAKPSIDSATATNVSLSSVDLRAAINPRAAQSTYRFEYGTSTGYGASVPVPEGVIASGLVDRAVARHVGGLQANTTYHWRVVAQNLAGVTTGGDHTFIYSTGTPGLPDGRAYEMVTPPHKDGALIGGAGDGTGGLSPAIGEDGSRVIMSTFQCFGNAVSCPPSERRFGTPYMFTHSVSDWSASALAPSASQFATNVGWLMSADSGMALFTMGTPSAKEADWYVRGIDGEFRNIGPAFKPHTPAGETDLVRATSDLSRIVYVASPSWPFDSTVPSTEGAKSLYEYLGLGNTAPLLVGVTGGRGSTDLISVCRTSLGSTSEADEYNALSGDGRTVFFTARRCASGSGVNAGVEVPADTLYARVDESRTVPISVRSPLECTAGSGCLGSSPAQARFMGASSDGSNAFFTDIQQLTDNASEDSNSADHQNHSNCNQMVGSNGCNLYMYDFANPAGRNLVAVSAGDTSGGGPRVQGVVAIAPDGSHIYFVARGVLTSVANERGQVPVDGGENMYVYERDAAHPGGRVSFIATVPEVDDSSKLVAHLMWSSRSHVDDVTPEGRFLVFTSSGDLTADTSSTGVMQVFRYDAQTGQLIRISIGEDGFNDNGNRGLGSADIVSPEETRAGSVRADPTMSSDGSFVFFDSPVALTPGALDNVQIGAVEFVVLGVPAYAYNVYEWHEGHVYLLSDGRDTSASSSTPCWQHESSVCLLGADASGHNVFFTTADPLVPEDVDTQLDVYDARVCTAGEPCAAPVSAPSGCAGEACRGAAGSAPGVEGAGTVAFNGPGNLAPPPTAVVKTKAKKHTQRAHGKPKAKKRKTRSHTQGAHGRSRRRAVRSGGRHGHTSSRRGK